jgi:hypothetical protein
LPALIKESEKSDWPFPLIPKFQGFTFQGFLCRTRSLCKLLFVALPFWEDVRKNLGIELILENVEGGDGAILTAKEKFAEEPPRENGRPGGDDVHHL